VWAARCIDKPNALLTLGKAHKRYVNVRVEGFDAALNAVRLVLVARSGTVGGFLGIKPKH
jgi:hypothetical protein